MIFDKSSVARLLVAFRSVVANDWCGISTRVAFRSTAASDLRGILIRVSLGSVVANGLRGILRRVGVRAQRFLAARRAQAARL
jgi:hypothetical protein